MTATCAAIVALMTGLCVLYAWKFPYEKMRKCAKILALILGGFFAVRLFTVDYVDNMLGLDVAYFGGAISRTGLALMVILRFFTAGGVLLAMVSPFYRNRFTERILAFVLPVIALCNLVFFRQNMLLFLGENASEWHYRAFCFAAEIALLAAISALQLTNHVQLLRKSGAKAAGVSAGSVLAGVGVLVLCCLAAVPRGFFQNLFGLNTWVADDFSLTHRITIYVIVGVGLGLFFCFRKKPLPLRDQALTTVAVAAFMNYFYSFDYLHVTFTSLPLHLCNMAIVLMFFAFTCKNQKLFYFNYFVNVLGALFAILLPNVTEGVLTAGGIHFWWNHAYAFILPIVAVSLGVFPRPNLKLMLWAVVVFTGYFVLTGACNAVFSYYEPSVDYFFMMSDFLPQKVSILYKLFQYKVQFPLFGITLTTYPWYWLLLYVGYIGLMFVMWLFYVWLYRVTDDLVDLGARRKQAAVDHMRLMEDLGGRKESEPLYPEEGNMIEISHFTKRYASEKAAVEDFTLTVNAGEIFGFLGHNGAGKSTTIKAIVGIHPVTSGQITVCGYDVMRQPVQAKSCIGYVPDHYALYERLTGREYINYVADLYRVSEGDRVERIERYVDMFRLEKAFDNQIKTYSHGMKQKIAVIAALVHEPRVWILDEPLTGLDPTSIWQIKECMKEHAKKGNVVFFSSHIIDVVERLCDRIAIIKQGKLVCETSMASLRERGEELEQLYLKYVESVGDTETAEGAEQV